MTVSQTTSATTDGKVIGEALRELTGREDVVPPEQVRSTFVQVKEIQSIVSERIEPAHLYRYFSSKTGEYEIDSPIAVVSQRIGEVASRLELAIQEKGDQLQRENHVAIAISSFYELAAFMGLSATFDEAYVLALSAVESHRATPYTYDQLVALQKVFQMLRRTPRPTSEDVDLIYEALDHAGFDLNAPLSGAELSGDGSEC